MVRRFSVSADLNLPAKVFFLERDRVAFRCLLAKALALGSLEFTKEEISEHDIKVWQTTFPQFDKYVPSSVAKLAQKLIGSKLVYTDVLTYPQNKAAQNHFQLDVTSIAPVFRDKTTLKSKLIIEQLTATSCRQTLEGSIEIRVVGLGSTAEKIIVQQLTTVYKSIPAVVNRWLQLRRLLRCQCGPEWLVLGRPNTQADWTIQEYQQYAQEGLPWGLDTMSGGAELDKEEQLILQKAKEQLQRQVGGLKQLPTVKHNIGSQMASKPVAGTPATALTSNSMQPQELSRLSAQKDSTISIDSTFTVPDRATSTELAFAEDPMPYVDKGQKAVELKSVSEYENGSQKNMSYGQQDTMSKLDGPAPTRPSTPDASEGRKLHKKPRDNAFLKCIPCGRVQHASTT